MKKRILFVEDEDFITSYTLDCFLRNYDVFAFSQSNVLPAIRSGLRYDLAIIDLEPAGDVAIRESKIFNPNTPVIIYSGYDLTDDQVRRLEGDRFVLKMEGYKHMEKMIKRLLEKDVPT